MNDIHYLINKNIVKHLSMVKNSENMLFENIEKVQNGGSFSTQVGEKIKQVTDINTKLNEAQVLSIKFTKELDELLDNISKITNSSNNFDSLKNDIKDLNNRVNKFINKNIPSKIENDPNEKLDDDNYKILMTHENAKYAQLLELYKIYMIDFSQISTELKNTNDLEETYEKLNGEIVLLTEKIKEFENKINSQIQMSKKNIEELNKNDDFNARDIKYSESLRVFTSKYHFDKKIWVNQYDNNILIKYWDSVYKALSTINLKKSEIDRNSIETFFTDSVKKENVQKGGEYESFKDLNHNLQIVNEKLISIHQGLGQVRECNDLIYKLKYRQIKYLEWLMSCIKDNIATTIFVTIDVGTVAYYSKIINNIIKDFSDKKNKLATEYNVKHYFAIFKLQHFFEFIEKQGDKKFTTNGLTIDINKCKDKVHENFVLFNFFKQYLDTYNEQVNLKLQPLCIIYDLPEKVEQTFVAENNFEIKINKNSLGKCAIRFKDVQTNPTNSVLKNDVKINFADLKGYNILLYGNFLAKQRTIKFIVKQLTEFKPSDVKVRIFKLFGQQVPSSSFFSMQNYNFEKNIYENVEVENVKTFLEANNHKIFTDFSKNVDQFENCVDKCLCMIGSSNEKQLTFFEFWLKIIDKTTNIFQYVPFIITLLPQYVDIRRKHLGILKYKLFNDDKTKKYILQNIYMCDKKGDVDLKEIENNHNKYFKYVVAKIKHPQVKDDSNNSIFANDEKKGKYDWYLVAKHVYGQKTQFVKMIEKSLKEYDEQFLNSLNEISLKSITINIKNISRVAIGNKDAVNPNEIKLSVLQYAFVFTKLLEKYGNRLPVDFMNNKQNVIKLFMELYGINNTYDAIFEQYDNQLLFNIFLNIDKNIQIQNHDESTICENMGVEKYELYGKNIIVEQIFNYFTPQDEKSEKRKLPYVKFNQFFYIFDNGGNIDEQLEALKDVEELFAKQN